MSHNLWLGLIGIAHVSIIVIPLVIEDLRQWWCLEILKTVLARFDVKILLVMSLQCGDIVGSSIFKPCQRSLNRLEIQTLFCNNVTTG